MLILFCTFGLFAETLIDNGPTQKITNEMNFEQLCKTLHHFSINCRCKYVRRDLPDFFDKDGRTIWFDKAEKQIIYNKDLSTYKEKKEKLLNMYKPVINYIDKFYSMPIKQLEKKHLSGDIYYIGDSGYGNSGFCCEWHGTALAQRGSAKAQYTMGFRLLGSRYRYYFARHFDKEAFEEDVLWLKLAGENGISGAYWVLGKKSFLLKEYKAALMWYRKGADAKNTRCMYELGEFCLKEMNDGIEALRWYIPAADLGHYQALKACAELYSRNTKNTRANYRQAVKYYQKLIEQEKKDKSRNYQDRIQYYKKRIEDLKLKIED